MPRPPLSAAFAALADPTRLAIIERFLDGEAMVGELARPCALTRPAISRHLRVVEEAGLTETRVAGASSPRRLRPEAVEALWTSPDRTRRRMARNCDRLDALLAEPQADAPEQE